MANAKRSAFDLGVAFARGKLQRLQGLEREATRYMILCNLIETMWVNRAKKYYYKVDYARLMPLTSPQAREIAAFIHSLYEDDCVKASAWDDSH
jgi:hypothetical protein